MFQKIRISILPILILIISFSCEKQASEKLPLDIKAELIRLPAGVNAIGYFNAENIVKSEILKPFIDSVRTALLSNEELQDLFKDANFDPEKDLKSIFIALKMSDDKENPSFFQVAKGNFKEERIISFVRQKDEKQTLKSSDYAGYKLYSGKKENFSVCFYDKNTLLAGNTHLLKEWIDNKQNTHNQELLKQIANLRYKTQMWLAVETSELAKRLDKEKISKNLPALKFLKSGGVSFNFNDNIRFYGESSFINKEKAELFLDTIKGLLSAAKLGVSNERELVDLINEIKLEANQNTISMAFRLSVEEIKNVIDKKKKLTKVMALGR